MVVLLCRLNDEIKKLDVWKLILKWNLVIPNWYTEKCVCGWKIKEKETIKTETHKGYSKVHLNELFI